MLTDSVGERLQKKYGIRLKKILNRLNALNYG
jgi:hypothetical protein